jgi:hypothetical protein
MVGLVKRGRRPIRPTRCSRPSAPKDKGNRLSDAISRGMHNDLWADADLTPVEKVTFVARAGDQGCGVGYYKYAVQQPINLPGSNVGLPWQR